MITLNAFLFWAILSVIFMAGFLTCSLLCINDLKSRLTQTPEEAAKDESHSATRYEEPPTEAQIKAARYAATAVPLCGAPDGITCLSCYHNIDAPASLSGFCSGGANSETRTKRARDWLISHNLPLEAPK